MSESDEDWFAHKRFGMGPGLPITWQGWAILLGYLAAIVAIVLMFRGHPVQLIAALVPLTATYLVIAGRRTRGGWRWKWGEEE